MLTYNAQLGLSQCVTNPTKNKNLPDPVFTNTPDVLHGLSIQLPFFTSDQVSIHFSLYIGTYMTAGPSVSLPTPLYNYACTNFHTIIADLRFTDCTDTLTNDFTVQSFCDSFVNIITLLGIKCLLSFYLLSLIKHIVLCLLLSGV